MAGTTKTKDKTVTLTTGVGIFGFPRVFKETHGTNDSGDKVWNIQILLSKANPAELKRIKAAVEEVAVARFGKDWRDAGVKDPLRDGDKEKGKMDDQGAFYKDKYPERLGHMFMNASTRRVPPVFDRVKDPIMEESEIYGGVKGRISITFYPYVTKGNMGVAARLEGVQKIADGEPIGTASSKSADEMFDSLPDDLDLDLDQDEKPAKKAKKDKSEKAPKGKADKVEAPKTKAKKK